MDDDSSGPKRTRRSFFVAPLKWITTLILGAVIVSVALNGFSAPRAEAWVTWHASHGSFTGAPTDCTNTAWLQVTTPASAEAYNVLAPDDGISYAASNTIDGSDQTAWAQKYPAGNGQATITWVMPHQESLRLACMEVGYAKDYVSFERNERLKSATLTFPGTDCAVVNVSFPDLLAEIRSGQGHDYTDMTAVPLKCKTAAVRMTVDSTYPASDGTHDLAVSGLEFFQS